MSETKTKNIYEKLASIRDKVGTIPKNGYNKFSHYKYVAKDELYDYFRAFFAQERLFVFASTESTTRIQRPGKDGITINASLLHKKFTIVNIDNPEEKIEVYSDGVGEDKTDKDIYQGDTGAMKYFLIDNFLVSGGDSFPGDVEHDSNNKVKKQKDSDPPPQVQYGLSGIEKPEQKKVMTPQERIANAKKYLERETKSDDTFYSVLESLGIKTESKIKDDEFDKVINALLSKTQEIVDAKKGK